MRSVFLFHKQTSERDLTLVEASQLSTKRWNLPVDMTIQMCVATSVTKQLNYFSIFGHLQQWNLAQQCRKFTNVCSTFCQIRNKPSNNCPIEVIAKVAKFHHIWSHWLRRYGGRLITRGSRVWTMFGYFKFVSAKTNWQLEIFER